MKKILVVSFQSITADFAEGMAKVGYEVSRILHQRGELVTFVVSSKGSYDTPFPSTNCSALSRLFFKIFRIFDCFHILKPHISRHLKEVFFDLSVCRLLSPRIDVIISTNAFMPRTFRRAKCLGLVVVLVPGNPEEELIRQTVKDEWSYLGSRIEDAYSCNRRFGAYQRSMPNVDVLFGFSNLIADSFEMRFRQLKVVRRPVFFARRNELVRSRGGEKTRSSKTYLTVGYLAHTVVLKGLHRLISVWFDLGFEATSMRLIVGGNIDKDLGEVIARDFRLTRNHSIEFIGQVTDLDGFFNRLDVFVVPSLIDGGPLTIMEALQRSIPVLATNGCGYSQYVINGINGWVVGSTINDLRVGIEKAVAGGATVSSPGIQGSVDTIEDLATAIVQNVSAI